MIKNQIYINKQKKRLLKKKKIKFKLDLNLKHLNILLKIFKFKYLIFLQYFINSTENFIKIKLFLSNINSEILVWNKKIIKQKLFFLNNNCIIIGLNDLNSLLKLVTYFKLNKNFYLLGFLINKILFSKYDLNITNLNINSIYLFIYRKLINFLNLLQMYIYSLFLKLTKLINYGNN